jgi:hypothetical protein
MLDSQTPQKILWALELRIQQLKKFSSWEWVKEAKIVGKYKPA